MDTTGVYWVVPVLVLHTQCTVLPSYCNMNLRLSNTKHIVTGCHGCDQTAAIQLLSWMSFANKGILHIHIQYVRMCCAIHSAQEPGWNVIMSRFPLVLCVQQVQAKGKKKTYKQTAWIDKAKSIKCHYCVRININFQSQNGAITLHTVHTAQNISSYQCWKNSVVHCWEKISQHTVWATYSMDDEYTVLVMVHTGISITNGYINKSWTAKGSTYYIYLSFM